MTMEKLKLETKCGRFTMHLSRLENGYHYLREYDKHMGTSVKARISKIKFESLMDEIQNLSK